MKFFSKKIPVIYSILLAVLCVVISILILKTPGQGNILANQSHPEKSVKTTADCSYVVARIKGYQYVKPILNERPECEARDLTPLKAELSNYIDAAVNSGNISTASVYLRTFSTDGWININDNEQYHPGSLIKLPMFISFLRMAETHPEIMDKKITCKIPPNVIAKQTFENESIENGKTYTIRELLNRMIIYSDNRAAYVLNSEMNFDVLFKVFKDEGLSTPSMDANYFNYTLSARNFSLFMESLYNATYLTITASEYATSVLAKSTFNEGLRKYIPKDVMVAHKFGEAGIGNTHELHESGIVYIGNNAYLLTVMTKGPDVSKLSETIGQISKMTYDKMKGIASM